ncbi:MAG: hypothetical protein ABWJ97_00730 [Thermoproteus sp.]
MEVGVGPRILEGARPTALRLCNTPGADSILDAYSSALEPGVYDGVAASRFEHLKSGLGEELE